MMETVSGISSASQLNDISIVSIFNEPFDSDPIQRGWTYGSDWVWDSANNRMKIA